jgi:hypothetical protein
MFALLAQRGRSGRRGALGGGGLNACVAERAVGSEWPEASSGPRDVLSLLPPDSHVFPSAQRLKDFS